MWGPVSVKDRGGVSSSKGDNIWKLGGELVSFKGGWKREDGECAASGRVPVDADVSLLNDELNFT